MKALRNIIYVVPILLVMSIQAWASGPNFNDTTQQAIAPNQAGNVGIGSAIPIQKLDVAGTVRMVGLTMSGSSPISGYVLTASDSAGDSTWSSAGGVSGWTVTGSNVYETFNGNVGIGTNLLTTAALTVMNGNVGIGTWIPADTFQIGSGPTNSTSTQIDSGSVSTQSVSVTNRYYFGNTNQSERSFSNNIEVDPNAGFNVLGNVGIGTESSGSNAGIASTLVVNGGVGIGTGNASAFIGIAAPSGGLVVQNNVGIGTWLPLDPLQVGKFVSGTSGLEVSSSGNVGIGTINTGYGLSVLESSVTQAIFASSGANNSNVTLDNIAGGNQTTVNFYDAGAQKWQIGKDASNWFFIWDQARTQNSLQIEGTTGDMVLEGTADNVGIGSLSPGQKLDINGTVRTKNFTMSGQAPIAGYVLTASDSAGEATWSSAGGVSGWTVTGSNVYETNNGNVGIGTTLLTTSALTVMNGNVGIGTWLPAALLNVNGNSIVGSLGSTTDSITSSGTGSWAGGNASHIALNSGIITSSGTGSLAFGYAQGSGAGNGSIISNNFGSIALGAANAGTLGATGNASVAIGTNVQATNSQSFALGSNVINPTANTFMVGFNINTNPTLTVTSTNVGIGTWNPFGGGLIVTNGNVGLGSLAPGTALDVNGTARMTGFALTGNGAASGNVMVGNSVGVGTWMATSTLPLATVTNETTGDVTFYNGINTFAGGSGFQTNGTNVGIGTSGFSHASFQVVGNIGIGTVKNGDGYILNSPPNGSLIVEGNIGIGTWTPEAAIQVGQIGPVSGPPSQIYFSNTSTTGAYPQFLGQWAAGGSWGIGPDSTAGDNNLEIGCSSNSPGNVWGSGCTGLNLVIPLGNVGIGTTFTVGGAALTVMNGNVGIGTWAPSALLQTAAGTTAIPPIMLTSGTNLTTAAAGAIEFDGSVFYDTAKASSRQVIDSEQFMALTGNYTLTSTTSIQQAFGSAGGSGGTANGAVTVPAHGTYLFEALYLISNGTTTHETGVGFGGTATISAVDYSSYIWSVAPNTPTTAQTFEWIQSTAVTNCNSTNSSAATTAIVLKGIIRVSGTGGTIIPEVKFSAAPGGANAMNNDSYFRLYSLGSDTIAFQGDWS